jgi:hypothetical protein
MAWLMRFMGADNNSGKLNITSAQFEQHKYGKTRKENAALQPTETKTSAE